MMIRNVRAAYRSALAHGIWNDWYANIGARVESEARAAGIPLGISAGVLAVMSPRVQWEKLLKAWPTILGSLAAGTPIPAVGLRSNRTAAELFYRTGEPSGLQWGPKVQAFYRAILGDPDAVVLDVWAIRVATRGKDVPLTVGRRKRMTRAYRRVAEEHDVPARLVQSRTWELIRS